MANEQSLDGIVYQENRLKRLGTRALNELKLLPYEITASLLGYSGGAKVGESVSKMFPVPPDSFFLDMGQKLQDKEYALVGGALAALLAVVGARYLGKYINIRIGNYMQKNTAQS